MTACREEAQYVTSCDAQKMSEIEHPSIPRHFSCENLESSEQ